MISGQTENVIVESEGVNVMATRKQKWQKEFEKALLQFQSKIAEIANKHPRTAEYFLMRDEAGRRLSIPKHVVDAVRAMRLRKNKGNTTK
jgi:hypothetical protein